MLKRRGIERVRPLEGGFDAWLAAGRPIEPIEPGTRAGADPVADVQDPSGISGGSA